MPYRRYVFYSRTTATCPSCGRAVRIHDHAKLVTAGLIILAALFVAVLLAQTLRIFAIITVILALTGLLVDYLGYRLLVWDPVKGDEAHPPHPTGAAPA
jgi:hypothetical protein